MSFAKTAISAFVSLALIIIPTAASARDDGYYTTKPDGTWKALPNKTMPLERACISKDDRWSDCGNYRDPRTLGASTPSAENASTSDKCNFDGDTNHVLCHEGKFPLINGFCKMGPIMTQAGVMIRYQFEPNGCSVRAEEKGHPILVTAIIVAAVACAVGALCKGQRYYGGYSYSGPGFSAGNAPSYESGFGYYQMCRNNRPC
jgi:hypothetical protein